ncbi:MAG: hypothetical protein EBZ48_13900, partial [Proteobacteria bacterium]|nr:hypothetical protein [Pseudomonadota bacterium]
PDFSEQSLAAVAHELCPEMTYPGWKAVRGSFGKAALRERLRRHELSPAHPLYVAKPRLWTFAGVSVEGGGARMLYLQKDKQMLVDVWLRGSEQDVSFHELALRRSRELPPEPWPQHLAELEYPANREEASDDENI